MPFRIGHSFASLIVEKARADRTLPKNFAYADAQALYTQAADKHQWKDNTLPLSEADFRASLSPRAMVQSRKGTGGPQPEEVRRMLAEAGQRLQDDQAWMQQRRQKLADAGRVLDKAFEGLMGGSDR
ncbi:argininosuccinate lyase [Pseudomonas sp. S36]|nr:argininosuccinate lyase [Pseudomonas sp. S36]